MADKTHHSDGDDEAVLAKVNDDPAPADDKDAADGEDADTTTVLGQMNDSPRPDKDEPR